MARLDQHRRAAVLDSVPPTKCGATVKSTGLPCERYVTVGASRCHMHGAASRHVRARAEARVSLAEAMTFGPRRSPAELLTDASHLADVLLARSIESAGETTDPLPFDVLEQLTASLGRVAHLAKINLDAGLDASKVNGEQTDMLSTVLLITCQGLGLKVGDSRVGRALAGALKAVDAAGPKVTDRAKLIADTSAKLAADRIARSALDEAAQAKATQAAIDKHVAGLRQRARHGLCEICGTAPGLAAPQALPAAPAPMPDPDAPTSPAPPQRADGASEPDVIVGEIVDEPPAPRSLPRYPHCQACGGIDDPGHSRFCPGGGGFGSFGVWGR